MESEKIETGQKLIRVRQGQANVQAGQYDLTKPLSAEDFSSADEAGATQVYNELMKFGNP